MPSNGFSLELPIGKVSKVKDHQGDAIYSVDELGAFDGSFAIASSKKELKALMKSDADVVYDESKGKLYLNKDALLCRQAQIACRTVVFKETTRKL